jgi:hypothetical protein
MKKLLLALIPVIALGACTTERIVERVPATVASTQAPYTDNSSYAEQNFIEGLTADHPTEVTNLGKTSVIELGRLTCGTIDEGSTLSDFVEMANDTGVSAEFIGSLIREAVENFCPENQWFIDAALNA